MVCGPPACVLVSHMKFLTSFFLSITHSMHTSCDACHERKSLVRLHPLQPHSLGCDYPSHFDSKHCSSFPAGPALPCPWPLSRMYMYVHATTSGLPCKVQQLCSDLMLLFVGGSCLVAFCGHLVSQSSLMWHIQKHQ